MKVFKDRVAVITGAASGFGREFALIGARLGMKLVLADVQQDALDKTKAELEQLGTQVIALRCDVRHAEQVQALADADIPVISAINGPAVGAGLSFALAVDIVVMARSAYLMLAFANIGLVPDAGATWLVAKSAGRAKALEMALLGEKVSAEQALDLGLVTRLAEDDAVLADATAIAARLAAGPSIALGLIRKQIAAALNMTLIETFEVEKANQQAAGRTRDYREAVNAFAEKRKPQFKGQ